MPFCDSDEEIREILETSHRIAVVGFATNPGSDSYRTIQFLLRKKYDLFLIHPLYAWQEVLGLKVYASFWGLPAGRKVDMAVIFGVSSDITQSLIESAIARDTQSLWLEKGVINLPMANYASMLKVKVVMDRSVMEEYKRLRIRHLPPEES